MGNYEVRVIKHWSGKTYNVNLASFDKKGYGVSYGKAFNVSKKEADKEAKRVADLYGVKEIIYT
jgi:hypothetical protein